MNNIKLPKFDYKRMEEQISKEWYAKQEGQGYTVVLSINETVEQIGNKVQNYLKENINKNLKFSIYMNEEGIITYRLSYAVEGAGRWTLNICTIEDDAYDSNYCFATNCINNVLSKITTEHLDLCNEYSTFLVEAKEKYKICIMYGDYECINVSQESLSVPGELISYKMYSDIIKYFVRNSKRILKRRKKAIYGRYFFDNMIIQRTKARKSISYINYTEYREVFKVL